MSEAPEPERYVTHKIPLSPVLRGKFPHLGPFVWRVWDKDRERYVPFSNTSDPRKAQHMLRLIREREAARNRAPEGP